MKKERISNQVKGQFSALFSIIAAGLFISNDALALSPYKTKDSMVIGTNATMSPNWQAGQRTGANCNGAFSVSTTQYAGVGTIKGFSGNTTDPQQPIVALNGATTPVSFSGFLVPGNAGLMHPGPNNECAVLRYKITTAGTYSVEARFLGAYQIPGKAPPVPGGVSNGDGVNGMVNLNVGSTTSKIIGNIDTQTSQNGEARTSQPFVVTCEMIKNGGVSVDYAIHMKSNYLYDSTVFGGKIVAENEAECKEEPPKPVVEVCCSPTSDPKMGSYMAQYFIRSQEAASNAGTLTYQGSNAMNPLMQAYAQYVAASTNGGSGNGCTPVTVKYSVINTATTAIVGTLNVSYPGSGGPPTISSSGGFTQSGSNWVLNGLALNTNYDVRATTTFSCTPSPTGDKKCPPRGFYFSIGFGTYKVAPGAQMPSNTVKTY